MTDRTVAILPFGFWFEDYLDTIDVSIDSFCEVMTGGWLFNYADALRTADVRPVIIIYSRDAREPTRRVHRPTGTPIWVLGTSSHYRRLRRIVVDPYTRYVDQSAGGLTGARRLLYPVYALLKELSPYAATSISQLKWVLEQEACDVVLCQEYEFARFDTCVLAGRQLRVPVFATFQGGSAQMGYAERWVRPRTLNKAAGLIVASRVERERLRRSYPSLTAPVVQIYNPVQVLAEAGPTRLAAREELAIPPEARVAIWHGRVSREAKGLDVLIEAWERVGERVPDLDIRLLMLGTGEDAPWLRQRLAGSPARGVHWHDAFVHDRVRIRTYLAAADVYAFPSRHEGFPVAPIEGMACGLPLVAADAEGTEDILRDGLLSGGVVVPKDDPEAFADALVHFLENVEVMRAVGRHAMERAQTAFSVEATGLQLRQFLFGESNIKASA